jgi:hypothetical protein
VTEDERHKLRSLFRNPRFPIEATDPTGRVVKCGQKTWDTHIQERRSMEPFVADIREALRDPLQVNFDKTYDDRRNYYGEVGQGSSRYVKVTVRISRFGNTGNIVTSYILSEIPSKERIDWKRGQSDR